MTNGRHFPDDIFKCIFLIENVLISINISLKFVPKGQINNIPLSEPRMESLLTHICVVRPQWVNGLKLNILIYPDHVQKWLDFGHRLLIFLILVEIWLCETGQICDNQAFSWECIWIWHADVTWSPLELTTLWRRSADFPYFGGILTKWSR